MRYITKKFLHGQSSPVLSGKVCSENLGTYKHRMVAYTESDNTLCGGGAWPHSTNCWVILVIEADIETKYYVSFFLSN